MRRIVRQGDTVASPAWGHAVHVEVAGLAADRPYWYCFQALGARSAIGSARTLPAPHQLPAAAQLGFVSCSHWELGYFSAYRHLAAEQPDLVGEAAGADRGGGAFAAAARCPPPWP